MDTICPILFLPVFLPRFALSCGIISVGPAPVAQLERALAF